ncbi:hypothetical protein LCGC14_0485790 [marine sediment metagenome]|uniref:Uncharacterized protein n=1 Tax=marine sediment metagenome TaxID=412755 RepID=A0A0F9SR90_9ZZZZ
MRLGTLIILSVFLVGCSNLLINEDDPAGSKVVKVTARTLLGVGTLGISEIEMENIKYKISAEARAREKEKQFQQYLESLPPEERRALVNQLIIERERASGQTAVARERARGEAIQGYFLMRGLRGR